MGRGAPGGSSTEILRVPALAAVAAGLALAVAGAPLALSPALYDNFTLPKQAILLLAAAITLVGLSVDGSVLPRDRWLRVLLPAWLFVLLLSLVLGIDWRGSLLGTYQYRQGFLTQIAYLVLFLGALRLGSAGGLRLILLAAVPGVAGAALYTAVQAAGRDPVSWWVDTSDRAIGTIGNANELAAFAVVALALGGVASGRGSRLHLAAIAAIAAASSFILFASGSRSGMVAFAIVVVTLPLTWRLSRVAWRAQVIPLAALVMGVLLGAALSASAGTLQRSVGRADSAPQLADPGGSTRAALWRGTIATAAASPIWGFGPDGLYLAFPRHRPELAGAFTDYDLVAQSSHNWVLDTAANEGVLGVFALGGVLLASAAAALRAQRRDADPLVPLVIAALTGYAAMTLVNPISLAPHAIFWILLGLVAGRAAAQPLPVAATTQAPRGFVRVAIAAPAAAGLLAVAVALPMADRAGQEGWAAYASGNFVTAAERYDQAASLLPFERRYAADETRALLAAGVGGNKQYLERAKAQLLAFDRTFGFGSGEAVALATARIGLGESPLVIESDIDRAVALNPHGVSMGSYSARLRTAAFAGGILAYARRDRWVFVIPRETAQRLGEP